MRQSQILAADVPAVRDLYLRHAGLLRALLSARARVDRLYRRGPPGLVVTFDWAVVWSSLPLLLQGAVTTVVLTVITMALAIPLGPAGKPAWRHSPRSGSRPRHSSSSSATPLILQLYWASTSCRRFSTCASRMDDRAGRLVCKISSFNSETFRAGITSIREGQWNAGLALGMSSPQVFFRIVLPQAVMRVLPALASTWVSLFKDTSLVSVIAVADLSTSRSSRARDLPHPRNSDRDGGALLADGLVQAKLVDWIHRRFRVVE